MKILLDECVPARLKAQFTGVYVRTARDEQWTGIRNGELLSRMRAAEYEVLVTVDRNLTYQQNVALSGLAVIVMPRANQSARGPYSARRRGIAR